ncbi:MAG: hypothetical protein ACJ8CR_24270 [Roseiflexaceae bacterium]
MTATYNPVRLKQPISLWDMLISLPLPDPGTAFVLTGGGNRWETLWPSDRSKARQLRWRNYKMLYELDTTPHIIGFECVLPTKDDEFEFQADVQGICRVTSPITIIQLQVTDACAMLAPPMTRALRLVSRYFSIDQRGAAEQAMVKEVENQNLKLYGLELIGVVVRLGLTEEEQAHYRALRKIKRDLVREDREAELWRKRDEHEIARREFSFKFYNDLLKKGYGQLVILYLAHHPEELAHVWELLAGQEQINRKHWLSAFKELKELDVFEEPHLQEARNFVIQHFTEREKQELAINASNSSQKKP